MKGSATLLPCLVQALLWSERKAPRHRDLHSVELFAGEMQITKHMLDLSFLSVGFDCRYGENEDLCTAAGFEKALRLILRIRPCGHLWAAPVCSSWGFIGRSATGRWQGNAGGNRANSKTRNANRMVVLLTCLFLLAHFRGVHLWLEQPVSSLMAMFSPMAELMDEIMKCTTATYLFCFGSKSTKPIKIWSTCTLVANLKRKKPRNAGGLAERKGNHVNGNSKALKQSQSYPPAFGAAVSQEMKSTLKKRRIR